MLLDPTANPLETSDIATVLTAAQARVRDGDLDGAILLFDRLVTLLPSHPMPLLSLCTAHIQNGNWEASIAPAKELLEGRDAPLDEGIAPGCSTYHAAACVRLAKAYSEQGNREESSRYLALRKDLEERVGREGVHSVAPTPQGRAAILQAEGNKYYRDGDYAGAILSYCEALNIQPDSPELRSNTAQAMHMLGHDKEALPHIDRAIALRPTWPKAYHRRARILGKLGRSREALDALYRARSCCKSTGADEETTKMVESAITEARVSMKQSAVKKEMWSSWALIASIGAFSIAVGAVLYNRYA